MFDPPNIIPDNPDNPIPSSTVIDEAPELPAPLSSGASTTMEVDLSDTTSTDSEPEAIEARPVPLRPTTPPLTSLSPADLIARVERAELERDAWQLSCDRTAKLFIDYRLHNHQLLAEQRSHHQTVSALETQLSRTVEQLEIANARNAKLAEELASLRKDMKSGFPPLQRLEALSAEVVACKSRLEAYELRCKNSEALGDFFRDHYQDASNANYAKKKEIDELTREIERLRRLADERPIKLRELNNQMVMKAKEMEIVVLKETLKEREKKVERLERERKEREWERERMLRGFRGNWTTRSGSVPRRTPVGMGKASPGGSPSVSRTNSPPVGKEVKPKGS